MTIGDIELDRDEGPIGQGGSGARWITAPDGSKWSAKATYFGGHGHRYFYVNEALTKLIAERLDVRVPDSAALRLTPEQVEAFSPGRSEQDRVIFACRRIDGEALTPPVVQATAAADRAGIIVLDAAVWNTDDKAEHVIAEESTGEWRLWPVDHANCMSVADSLASLPQTDAPFQPFNLLMENVSRADINPWIERAKSIGEEEYADMVRTLPSEWVIEPDAPERLAEALFRRSQALDQVLYPVFP
jgi:hypothetical protein